MELENIIITIASGVSLFMVIASPIRNLWANIFLLVGFGGLFGVRLGHFMLMQYGRLNEKLHRTSSILTVILVFLVLLGFIFGRFLATSVFLQFPFGYYFILAAFYATIVVFAQTAVFKKFNPEFNIGTKKEEKRAELKTGQMTE